MKLIDGKLLADEILGEIFERGQASGLWEQQVKIGVLTYADIEFANGYDKALDEVYRKINDMPTVNAIPIEWLEQMWERDKDGFVDEYGVYHSSDDSLGESCKHVLENWNTNYKWKWVKENELDKM